MLLQVYPVEKVDVGVVYHRSCFKCHVCGRQLTIQSFQREVDYGSSRIREVCHLTHTWQNHEAAFYLEGRQRHHNRNQCFECTQMQGSYLAAPSFQVYCVQHVPRYSQVNLDEKAFGIRGALEAQRHKARQVRGVLRCSVRASEILGEKLGR